MKFPNSYNQRNIRQSRELAKNSKRSRCAISYINTQNKSSNKFFLVKELLLTKNLQKPPHSK